MLFNQHPEITFKDIKNVMKFDEDTCTKNLRSLMQKTCKVLQRKTESES